MLSVLLVDDEALIRMPVSDALRGEGYIVTVAKDGAEASAILEQRSFDVVVTDIRLPHVDGLTLFNRIRAVTPATEVILITAYGSVTDAVGAIKEGAYDYLTKPFETDELLIAIRRIEERQHLRAELAQAQAQLASRGSGELMLGRSPAMLRMQERVDAVAGSEAPVLVTGESGTGKELVARAIHDQSPRRERPYVILNCAAIPENLIEAELFGHERGAFTGAVAKRQGRIVAANGGTLVLDEIGEMPLVAQVKLLRVLESGEVVPVGTNKPISVDVRLVSSTNRDLRKAVTDGIFREDLYYRIRVLDIHIPPLRERLADLPILVEHFLRRYGKEGAEPPEISPEAWTALRLHTFPGNVRELMHAVEHAVVFSRGKEIRVDHLPHELRGAVSERFAGQDDALQPLSVAIGRFELEYLRAALNQCDGKKTKAAELLGISRKNLWEKLRQHGIGQSKG